LLGVTVVRVLYPKVVSLPIKVDGQGYNNYADSVEQEIGRKRRKDEYNVCLSGHRK
jgi:hypothetical protein